MIFYPWRVAGADADAGMKFYSRIRVYKGEFYPLPSLPLVLLAIPGAHPLCLLVLFVFSFVRLYLPFRFAVCCLLVIQANIM